MSEVINLNDLLPAAPTGSTNVKWQKGAATGTDISTGLPVFPVSAYVPAGVSGGAPVVALPDGAIDGVNTSYTLPITSSVQLYFRNGVAQNPLTTDPAYTIVDTLLTVVKPLQPASPAQPQADTHFILLWP